MLKNQSNGHTTFLRSQSYIVNGQPNPLSNISRNKYFSKYTNISNGKNKKMKKDKNYINLIKKKQKKKSFPSKKSNKMKYIKQNNNNNQEEYKEFMTEPYNYKPPKYPMSINKEQNDKKNCTEINLNGFINDSFKEKNNMEKENSKKMFYKTQNNFHNKISKRQNKIPYYNLNGVTKKKRY